MKDLEESIKSLFDEFEKIQVMKETVTDGLYQSWYENGQLVK